MSTEYNKSIVRRFFEDVFNEGRLELIEAIFAPNFSGQGLVSHGATGPERVRHTVQRWRAAFPDIVFAVDELIAEANNVVVRMTFRGTHQGEFMGLAATGRKVEVSGVEVARIAGGRIVEEGWHHFDDLSLLKQLGALPAHR